MPIKLKQLFNNATGSYTISDTEPLIKVTGDYWDERITSEVFPWIYNGSRWLSRHVYQRDIGSLIAGQPIGILGIAIGTISSSTEDISLVLGTKFNGIYLLRMYCGFRTTGTLTNNNYWRLNFKVNGTVDNFTNITSGDLNEATGRVRKTSADINKIYLNTAYYDVQLAKQANAPDIVAPVVVAEYRLIR